MTPRRRAVAGGKETLPTMQPNGKILCPYGLDALDKAQATRRETRLSRGKR